MNLKRAPSQGLVAKVGWLVTLLAIGFSMVHTLTEGQWSDSLAFDFGAPGTKDFIQYWSQFHAASHGENPYDRNVIARIQLEVGHDPSKENFPAVSATPPWFLVLLSPVLWLSFSHSAMLWMLLNMGFMLGITILMGLPAGSQEKNWLPILVGVVFFFPVWHVVWIGQISLLLTLSVAGLYWSVRSDRHFWTALFAVILTLKPHLFLLLGIALAYRLLQRRDGRTIAYFCGIFSGILVVLGTVRPLALLEWYQLVAGSTGDAEVTPLNEWITPTLAGLLRFIGEDGSGHYPPWPLVVAPAIAIAFFCVWLWVRRVNLDWDRWFVPLLALSLVFAPYAWAFDHAVLVVGQVLLISYCMQTGVPRVPRLVVLIALAAFELAMVFQAQSAWSSAFYFFWVPPVFLGVWLWTYRLLRPHLRPLAATRRLA